MVVSQIRGTVLGSHMVISLIRGPQYGPQYTIILIMGNPNKGTPNFRKSPHNFGADGFLDLGFCDIARVRVTSQGP